MGIQLCRIVIDLHSEDIMHGGIKENNFYYNETSRSIKVTDIALSEKSLQIKQSE
jgi:hypothetical protein